ncbi:hypothetical protein BDD12DRAFT_876690 [Trichophaea hybrida]|nr:hypothetical protein BDD12DRAFT_876690 [Trichophaea hybrida]
MSSTNWALLPTDDEYLSLCHAPKRGENVQEQSIPLMNVQLPPQSVPARGLPLFTDEPRATTIERFGLRWPSYIRNSKLASVSWRMGILLGSISVSLIFLLNLSIIIWAISKYPLVGGLGTIISGSCDKVKTMSTWIHVGINTLSTIALASSNYTQQVLMSPTRKEIDTAHKEGQWLDIGIPSVRNMRYIGRRAWLWWSIGLTSIPLHLLYNSAVFSTLSANSYTVTLIPEKVFKATTPPQLFGFFKNSSPFNPTLSDKYSSISNDYKLLYNRYSTLINLTTTALDTHTLSLDSYYSYLAKDSNNKELQLMLQKYKQLLNNSRSRYSEVESVMTQINNVREPDLDKRHWTQHAAKICINAYNSNILSRKTDLMIVIKGEDTFARKSMRVNAFSLLPQYWIGCSQAWQEENNRNCTDNFRVGTSHVDAIVSDVNSGNEWAINGYGVVKECWAEKRGADCRLQFSTTLLWIVIVCNFIKALCMILSLLMHDFIPLATLGDAIQSFMREPDPTTAGICWAGWLYIEDRFHQRWKPAGPKPVKWEPTKYRWWEAARLERWSVCVFCMSLSLIVTVVLLSQAVKSDLQFYGSGDIKGMWQHGFGQANLGSVFHLFGNLPLGVAILYANAPQALLSFLYLMYNAIFSSLLMGREWNRYSHVRKTLRVSDPQGDQRSTYWLHIPFRYAIPLMTLSGLLHWLVSQSIFVIRIQFVNSDVNFFSNTNNQAPFVINNLNRSFQSSISSFGFSTISIIFLLPAGVLAISAVVVCGLQYYDYDMPVAGSCSAAISAACHPIKIDRDATLRPLMWGDVSGMDKFNVIEGEQIRHLTFSDEDVQVPINVELVEVESS